MSKKKTRKKDYVIPPVPHTDAPPPVPVERQLDVQEVLKAIDHYYHETIDWEPLVKERWAKGFITWLYQRGVAPASLMNRWEELEFFIWFLDHHQFELEGIGSLRDFHVSEVVNEFWNRKVLHKATVAEKRRYVITVRDFYAYLQDTAVIEHYDQIQRAAERVAGRSGKLGRIRRPPPRGGEWLTTVHIPARGAFHCTYNDYWFIVVCYQDFDEDWQRMRQAAANLPDAATKQRIIDQLMAMAQHTDGKYPIGFLTTLRMSRKDVQKARELFYEGTVDETDGWASPP